MTIELSRRSPKPRTRDLERLVCRKVSEGYTWRDIDADDDLPCAWTVRNWWNEGGDFTQHFNVAQSLRAALYAERGLRVIEDADVEHGDPRLANARVNKARATSNYYQWLAGVTDRQQFGDKTTVDVRATAPALVAFADMGVRAGVALAATADAYVLPHVVAPDPVDSE